MWRYLYRYWLQLKESGTIFTNELYRIFHDGGVMIIFFLATLVYPFLYKAMYWNEQITDIPVAVVDLSNSQESREFLHQLNATPDVLLAYTCTSMDEAEILLRDQKVHGIIYFPRDYARQLADPLGQAHISLYCDMSSFLYMKGIYLSCNMVMLESMRNIQIDRYEKMGYSNEFSWELVQASPYTETTLFSPTGGYGSFLIPAVLVMVLHQTLFFGICMLAGTVREERKQWLDGVQRVNVWNIATAKNLHYIITASEDWVKQYAALSRVIYEGEKDCEPFTMEVSDIKGRYAALSTAQKPFLWSDIAMAVCCLLIFTYYIQSLRARSRYQGFRH